MSDQAILSPAKKIMLEINSLEALKEDLEIELKKKNSRYTAGEVTFGIGLIFIFIFPGIWFLWLFFITLGLLTWISAVIQRKELNAQIAQTRKDLATKRDQLIRAE